MADTSVSYKCPDCGAPLSFLPGHDKVTCEYCGNEFELKTIEELFAKEQKRAAEAEAAKEAQWKTADAGDEWSEEEKASLKTFTCSSCGAEIVTDENTIATECCYCGNPTMLPGRFEGALKPDYVIPFVKTKKDAVAALTAFYEGKRLLPDSFRANNRMEDIQGMYVPFWLFDSSVKAVANFSGEKVYTYEDDDERVTETSHYDCDRVGTGSFNKVPADGSKKMDDAYMDSVEPYDYSTMQEFTTGYLTGYLADKYDVDADTCATRTDERIKNSMIDILSNTMRDYDHYNLEQCRIDKQEGVVKYALAPVWILSTKFEDKPYTFMMNGQSGKMVGSLPVDKGKLYKYGAMSFVGFAVLIYIVAMFVLSKGGMSQQLMAAIFGSIICTAITCHVLISSMSNVAAATSAADYLDQDSVNIEDYSDTYLYTTQTRQPIPRNNPPSEEEEG